MASVPDEAIQPAMELLSDPLPSSLDSSNPMSISIPPSNSMLPLTNTAYLAHRRKRKGSATIKRSSSTPNVRGDAGMSMAEKRRNKLGYHRTSVACGHCRRRKIRCLAAPDDPQGRCANCIRLKKECQFFAVDQQPQLERRPRTMSRGEGRMSTSSESSPALHGGQMFTPMEPFNGFNTMPFAHNPDYPPGSAAINTTLVSPLTQVPGNGRVFDFQQATQQRASWGPGSPFPESGHLSAGYSSPSEAPPHNLWGRHADSPVTPNGYSPHASGPTSTMNGMSDPRASWPLPQRSMSFGIVEGGGLPLNGYDGSHMFQQPLSRDARRRASDMRPPSLQTGTTSSNASISESHMTPLSAPIQSPPSAHWSLSSGPWSAVPGPGKGYDANWYSDSAPLAKVQEEEVSPHYAGEPAIMFAGVEGA